ncbi:hypothetical protein GLOTRDRAFT_141635 [Gloeophyllum trabeum ATCC 11539]|uniref:Uncharacterized protein n=1 Tax=Gloeophyllum trabeum (strain ATCC 11539 / FP-39264 / Madison 617) TaxID=670483 RepID=S7R6P6_GLOTA|nr:uncharacterized protein GLOTRDRAFT_141635 [Gloeophyllum trabeum ATCC 11539]EPQ50060.1 hypothetical protein GLOTRDRAFT_141635 [Gloeophyllum trabeum ATCC 11539]
MNSYRDPAKLGLGTKFVLKASADVAVKETNSGLKRSSSGEGSGSNKKKKKAFSTPAASEEEPKGKATVPIGWVVIISGGLDEDGEPHDTIAPKIERLLLREPEKLAVSRNSEGSMLSFRVGWDESDVDDWLRGLFPEVFRFLDKSNTAGAERPWTLLLKTGTKLMKYPRVANGDALDTCKGGKGRKNKERVIHIATNVEIPSDLYTQGWKEDADLSPDDCSHFNLIHHQPPVAPEGQKDEDVVIGNGTTKDKGKAKEICTTTSPGGAMKMDVGANDAGEQSRDAVKTGRLGVGMDIKDIKGSTRRVHSPISIDSDSDSASAYEPTTPVACRLRPRQEAPLPPLFHVSPSPPPPSALLASISSRASAASDASAATTSQATAGGAPSTWLDPSFDVDLPRAVGTHPRHDPYLQLSDDLQPGEEDEESPWADDYKI